MRRNIIQLTVFLLLLGVGFFAFRSLMHTSQAEIVFTNKQTITAEVVKTDEAREKGLSNRSNLGVDKGMLFEFEQPGLHVFWMKDMNFPIDLIWIDGNKVIGFEQNMQPERPVMTRYSPKVQVNRVLELSAGLVQAWGLKEGDLLDIKEMNR